MSVFEDRGYEKWHTGGGCMAWRRDFGSHYALITDLSGAYLPDETDLCFAAVYDAHTGDQTGEDLDEATVPEALDWVAAQMDAASA